MRASVVLSGTARCWHLSARKANSPRWRSAWGEGNYWAPLFCFLLPLSLSFPTSLAKTMTPIELMFSLSLLWITPDTKTYSMYPSLSFNHNTHTHTSVSYTHLDVYKRQIPTMLWTPLHPDFGPRQSVYSVLTFLGRKSWHKNIPTFSFRKRFFGQVICRSLHNKVNRDCTCIDFCKTLCGKIHQ